MRLTGMRPSTSYLRLHADAAFERDKADMFVLSTKTTDQHKATPASDRRTCRVTVAALGAAAKAAVF